MQDIEIKAKTFSEKQGRVVHDSVIFRKLDKLFVLSFRHSTSNAIDDIETADKKNITKFCQLFGLTYSELIDQLGEGSTTVEGIQKFLNETVNANSREIVILRNDKSEIVNFVSLKHKQLPMTDIHVMVQKVSSDSKQIAMQETTEGYKAIFEVGTTPALSMRVTVDYGRNDARGRASIRFTGGGQIFVCSNMIIPFVHKSLQFRQDLGLEKIKNEKIIHTLNVSEATVARARQLFIEASQSSELMTKKLEDARGVSMGRNVQLYALELMKIKHHISDKQFEAVQKRLDEEDETLFGLSQALTWVGTRSDAPTVKDLLCRLGGQVVLLGGELVGIFVENFKQQNIELPKAVAA